MIKKGWKLGSDMTCEKILILIFLKGQQNEYF